jgi:hypothetical protein
MKENIAQQEEIRKVCAKFWAGVFVIILVSGAAIGMVGQQFIKNPPYMKLISNDKTNFTEAFEELSVKVDSIDTRVKKLETNK